MAVALLKFHTAVDPVCNMQVDMRGEGPRLCYEGRELFFCSEDCRRRFQTDPDRYQPLPSKPKSLWRRYLDRLSGN